MTEKELIRQADEKLERRLAEAAKIGNLVVTDAVRDEKDVYKRQGVQRNAKKKM